MEAGAQTGAVVAVVEGLARMDVAVGERGLPLTVRAGPAGRPPGPDAGEVMTTWLGVQSRPWRPAHLKLRPEAEGLRLSWTPRVRIGGDDWRLEPAGVEGTERFRVRIMAGDTVVRTAETAERSWLYPADAVAGDQGVHANLTLNVAQYGAGYGWGSEARRTI